MIGSGTCLPEIEDELIEPAALDEEQRAALWLYAWALADSRESLGGKHPSRRFMRTRWGGPRDPA